MGGHSVGIFGVVIVETALGAELGDAQRLIAQHRRRQFAAADERLGKQLIEFLPRPSHVAPARVAVIAVVGHDRDAHRRAFVDRFRSEEPTSELHSLIRISYSVFTLKQKTTTNKPTSTRL